MAKNKPFNNPFSGLKLKPAEPPKKAEPPKPKIQVPPKKVAPPVPVRDEDDESLFRRLFSDVEPVRGGPQVIPPAPPSPEERRQIRDEEEEVVDTLFELVAGSGPFDIADTDEYVEGAVAGLDKRIVRKLRRGDYSFQSYIDLHGLTRSEARDALENFIEESRFRGHRCVLVVHGRGLHSKDQVPVLKESVQGWLSHGRIGSRVLAFTSARPHDGGVGAVYVLLRR